MDCRTCPNLATMFFDQAARRGERPFLWAKRERRLAARSPGARRASRWRGWRAGLRALGLARGDRVGLVAENRPEWVIADLAIMAAGGVTVPAYTTNTVEDHRHILANSGARFAIVSTAALAQRVLPAVDQVARRRRRRSPSSRPTTAPAAQGAELHLWQDVLAARRRPGRGGRALGRRASAATTSPASSTPRAPAACPRA